MNINTEPREGFKSRLATIGTDSIRWDLATYGLDKHTVKKIRGCHVCTFYGVWIPFGILRTIILLLALFFVLCFFVPVAYLAGYTPTLVTERGRSYAGQKLFYGYKWSPTKGRYKLLAPWEYLAPTGIIVLVWYLHSSGLLSELWVQTQTFVVLHSTGIRIGLVLCSIAAIVTYLLYRRHSDLVRYFKTECPTMNVVEEPAP